jgi:hypothetical protein
VLSACLPYLIFSGYKYGLYHLISTNPAAQFTYCGIAVYFAGSAPSRRESMLAISGGLGSAACSPGACALSGRATKIAPWKLSPDR